MTFFEYGRNLIKKITALRNIEQYKSLRNQSNSYVTNLLFRKSSVTL